MNKYRVKFVDVYYVEVEAENEKEASLMEPLDGTVYDEIHEPGEIIEEL